MSKDKIIIDPEEFKKYNYDVKIQIEPRGCMHDACEGCKNGTCSGVHMISCPCPKCSPYC